MGLRRVIVFRCCSWAACSRRSAASSGALIFRKGAPPQTADTRPSRKANRCPVLHADARGSPPRLSTILRRADTLRREVSVSLRARRPWAPGGGAGAGAPCCVSVDGAGAAARSARPDADVAADAARRARARADLDNRTFTLTFAQPVPIRDLLLLLVRGTSLSIVPDPAITGTFIGELKNVTVRQALGLILRPLGLDYALDGSVVRVFRREPETRIFDLDYIASSAPRRRSVGIDLAGRSNGSYARVTTVRLHQDGASPTICEGGQTLLSRTGDVQRRSQSRAAAGHRFSERLDRVGVYLEAVQDRVQRQAQIDARLVEVGAQRREGARYRLDGVTETVDRRRPPQSDGRADRPGHGKC